MPATTKPGKKIIVACDGTWVNSDNGFERTSSWFSTDAEGVLAVPSNVTRFCRALQPTHDDGSPQLVYYQAGLGGANNWYSHYLGGFLGEGISENIREAYVFICDNYVEGDEIYLVGFSRGAFTARSVGGLIDAMGLLSKKGLADFYCIFRDWEHQMDQGYYKPSDKHWVKAVNIPEPRPRYGSDPKDQKAYIDQLVRLGLTRPKITVEATAVWDTVGSLGIPTFVVPPLSWFQHQDAPKSYAFINTEIPSNLKRAYHALALDERRTPFSPTIWELPAPGAPTQLLELKQCWFAGAHSNIGGSYPDTGTADITLAWMLQQLTPSLRFDATYLATQQQANRAYLQAQAPAPARPWSCGEVYRSGDALQDALAGSAGRTPGTYARTDPVTGRPTGTALRATHEFVHASVRVRRALGGRGTGDRAGYNAPWPLTGWTLVAPGGAFRADAPAESDRAADRWEAEWEACWKWVRQAPDGTVTWIAEDRMEGAEWDLVEKGSKAFEAIHAM